MSFLSKLFKRGGADDEGEDDPIHLDQDLRRRQLLRLEKALDQLADGMRSVESLDNPGWRVRVNEYTRLAGEAMTVRRGEITREGVLDLVFAIRPVFSGHAPDGFEQLIPLQDAVLAAAEELRVLAPSERG
ncbi:MAG TPA: hypothetical protein VFU98_03160 [Microlunatus sp.]|nr:hypothetical protein [Microlunatus sp.]